MTAEPAAPPAPAENGKPDKPETPKEKREGTKYVILEQVEAKDGAPAWRPVETAQTGAGKDVALKVVDDRDGTFKAVPETNWKGGKTYKQETRTVTVAEDFKD